MKIITTDGYGWKTALQKLLDDGWTILRADGDEVEVGMNGDDHHFARKRMIYILTKEE
jgi:hypothetical protein